MISKGKIKQIKALHLKKNRDEERLFFVEGVKPVRELLAQLPQLVKEIFASEVFIKENDVLLKTSKAKLSQINEKELLQISNQSAPNQVLALCRYFDKTERNFDFNKFFSLYLDDIRDPGNFGHSLAASGCAPGLCAGSGNAGQDQDRLSNADRFCDSFSAGSAAGSGLGTVSCFAWHVMDSGN